RDQRDGRALTRPSTDSPDGRCSLWPISPKPQGREPGGRGLLAGSSVEAAPATPGVPGRTDLTETEPVSCAGFPGHPTPAASPLRPRKAPAPAADCSRGWPLAASPPAASLGCADSLEVVDSSCGFFLGRSGFDLRR